MHAASWFCELDECHDEPYQRKKDVFLNLCGIHGLKYPTNKNVTMSSFRHDVITHFNISKHFELCFNLNQFRFYTQLKKWDYLMR